jgi:BMFP domain-containing protein YqiC
MAQTSNRILDEFARFMTDAAGVAKGVRSEVETVVRTQAEKVLRDLDVVQREEFEAVKEMAAKARAENDALTARIAALEAAGATAPKPKASSSKTAARKTTTTAKRTAATGSSESSPGGKS